MINKLKTLGVIFLPLQYQQFCSNYHGSNSIRLRERLFRWLIMNEKFFPRKKSQKINSTPSYLGDIFLPYSKVYIAAAM